MEDKEKIETCSCGCECEEIDDSKKIMEMIKENYPSLNDEKILMSFLYVIKVKGIKAFL